MMSGLRSHREYTMTWVSERSGSASRPMCVRLQTPRKSAAPVSVKTMNRFRAEKSMMRSIIDAPSVLVRRRGSLPGRRSHLGDRRFQARFGIDEKVGLGHDAFPRGEAFEDLVGTVGSGANLHLPGLDPTLAGLDESHEARSGREHRAVWNGQDAPERTLEDDVRVHLRLQKPVPIWNLDPHLERAGRRVENGSEKSHPSRPAAVGEIGQPDLGALTDAHEGGLRLVDVGQDPYPLQRGDLVETVRRHDAGARDRGLAQHESTHG